jgi:choline dehydrogenase-like flavoprotein
MSNEIVMTMLGAEAVGKTTLLATMFAKLVNLSDGKGFSLSASHDTSVNLTKAIGNLASVIEQPAFTDLNRLLPGTQGIGKNEFTILFKNQKEVNLSIYDHAGGLMMADKEDATFADFRKMLTQATTIINVVDGAAMVEGSELYSDKIHKPLRLVELLRPVLNNGKKHLVLFVITKCETWLKTDHGKKQLKDAFEKRHKVVLDLVRGQDNAVGVLMPVKTLGCVEFSVVENLGKSNEKITFTRNPTLNFNPEYIEQPLAYAMSFVLSQYLANLSWWQRFRHGGEYEEALLKLHKKCRSEFHTYGNFALLDPWTR